MKKLELIGPVKSSVQYRYISESKVFDKSELIGMGIQDKLQNEFSFSIFEFPKDPKKDPLVFRNGRIVIDGSKYILEELEIADVGLSTVVWGGTTIATQFIDKIVQLIEDIKPDIQIKSMRKRIKYGCEFKVKLEVAPQNFVKDQLVTLLGAFTEQIKYSEFSKTEINFPAMVFFFSSEPDTERILAVTSPDQIQTELRMATGRKSLFFIIRGPEDYKNRIYAVDSEIEFDKTKEILKKIEETLSNN